MAGTNAADYYDRRSSLTASPKAKLVYDEPKISTTSGITGYSTPAVGRNPAPIAAPYYNPAPAYTPPPQQQYVTPAPSFQQSFNQAPPPPPPPMDPPRPQFAPGGFQEFNQMDPAKQQMSRDKWLAGDSDYTEQIGLYQKALDDFVRRITGRIDSFNTDAKDATAGNLKNESMSADSLGADFGARGLSYSGLFDQSRNKLLDRYKEGRTNIEKNRLTNVQGAENEKADYTAENQISRKNAQRASLLRMAQQQQLLDSQYGF